MSSNVDFNRSIRGSDWPARSPDLNPLDFCMWCVLKSKVYIPKPRTMVELRNNITREVAQLEPSMLCRAILDAKNAARSALEPMESIWNKPLIFPKFMKF